MNSSSTRQFRDEPLHGVSTCTSWFQHGVDAIGDLGALIFTVTDHQDCVASERPRPTQQHKAQPGCSVLWRTYVRDSGGRHADVWRTRWSAALGRGSEVTDVRTVEHVVDIPVPGLRLLRKPRSSWWKSWSNSLRLNAGALAHIVREPQSRSNTFPLLSVFGELMQSQLLLLSVSTGRNNYRSVPAALS